ncbi:hypothetical protein Golomagni_00532 [Golovinomyces magnicellulatus]|nr:hypothetical protein Golomagni_00532 [Golovinomyces magnicellulatus]
MSTELPSKDFYKVLGVPKNATLSEIRSAHRKLVLKCHPDKIHDQSLKVAKQLEFQKVQEAYETLSDPLKRDRYDALVLQHEIGRKNPFEFEVKIPKPDPYFSKTTVKVHTYKNDDSEGFTIFRETYGSNKPFKSESSHIKTTKYGQTRREEANRSPKGKDSQQEKKNAKDKIEKERKEKDKEKKEKEKTEKERREKERKEKEKEKIEKEKIEKERKDKRDKENREKEKKEKEKKRKEKERKRDADEKLSRKTQVYLKDYLDDDFSYPRSSERKLTKAHTGGAQKTPKDSTSQDHTEMNIKFSRHIKSVLQVPDVPFPGIKRMKSHSRTSNFEKFGQNKNTERSSTAWKSKDKHKTTESYEKPIANAPNYPTRRKSSQQTNSSTPLSVRQKSSHVIVREPTLQRSQTNSESRRKQNKKPENTVQPHHSSNKKNYNAESNKIRTEFCTVNDYTSYSHSQFSQNFYQSPNQPFSVAYYTPEPVLLTQSTSPAVSSSPGIQAVDEYHLKTSAIVKVTVMKV